MMRAVLLLTMVFGLVLVLGFLSVDAGRKHRHRQRPSLVVQHGLGHRWPPDLSEILVINHSHVAAEEVEAGVVLWNLPGVPLLRVVQAAPLPCKRLRPRRGTVMLCSTIDPTNVGWERSYTNEAERGKTRKRQRYTQAAMIGIDQSNEFTFSAYRDVISHEMGHALGLRHIDSCQCIMNQHLFGVSALAPEDIAALRRLYP